MVTPSSLIYCWPFFPYKSPVKDLFGPWLWLHAGGAVDRPSSPSGNTKLKLKLKQLFKPPLLLAATPYSKLVAAYLCSHGHGLGLESRRLFTDNANPEQQRKHRPPSPTSLHRRIRRFPRKLRKECLQFLPKKQKRCLAITDNQHALRFLDAMCQSCEIRRGLID